MSKYTFVQLFFCTVLLTLIGPKVPATPAAEFLPPICPDDGHLTAPIGTSPHPGLLAKYKRRPPCQAAGIDYRVGYKSALVLKDPAEAVWRYSFSYDSSRHMLRCNRGSGGIISGYDFSLHGGMGIYDASCVNLTIENSKFVVGPNCLSPINQATAASGINVRNNLIDGGGYIAECAGNPVGEDILLGGNGPKIIEYNWMRNAAQHFVTLAGTGGSVRVRYNLVERCGFYQGNHCNGIQFVGGVWYAPVISNNTFISDQPDSNGSLYGKQTAKFLEGSNVAITGSRYGLVTVEHTYAASVAPGMSIISSYLPSLTKIVSVSNSGGPCCVGAGAIPVVTRIVLSQRSIKTGEAQFDVPDVYPSGLVNPIQVEAQLQAVIKEPKIQNNVVIALPGAVNSVSYAISLNSDISSLNIGAFVIGNYIDPRGAYGAFYPSDCFGGPRCHDAHFSDNVDMTSGADIEPKLTR